MTQSYTVTPDNLDLKPRDHRAFPRDFYASLCGPVDKNPVGFVAEMDAEIRAKMPAGTASGPGFYVPLAELCRTQRALTAGSFSGGGAMVEPELGEIQHLLRAYAAPVAAGCQVVEGLQGNFSSPVETTGVTWNWASEGAEISESTPVFGARNSNINRGCAACSLTQQMETQSAGLLSTHLIGSLARGVGALATTGLIQGTGTNGQPQGILYTSGANTVDFSGSAATLAKAQSFVEQCATANADDNALTFIAHPAVRTRWQALQKYTGSSTPLWDFDGTVLGKKALVTSAAPATSIVCGDWSQAALLFFGPWGAIRIVKNPYTLALSGAIRFYAECLMDTHFFHPAAHTVSISSAVI